MEINRERLFRHFTKLIDQKRSGPNVFITQFCYKNTNSKEADFLTQYSRTRLSCIEYLVTPVEKFVMRNDLSRVFSLTNLNNFYRMPVK